MKKHEFYPTEIIFSATTACNLHCPHCFVNRDPQKLDIENAINFLKSCTNAGKNNTTQNTPSSAPIPQIEKIGFSGGEPFLYMDFLLSLTKAAIEQDLLFDQIMTNGDWWKDEADLKKTLQTLYESGYDGKIGLSWDNFHAQNTARMEVFIKTVQTIFGEDSINIQSVQDYEGRSLSPGRHSVASTPLTTGDSPRNAPELPPSEFIQSHPEIPVYTLPQTFTSDDERAWKSKRWFKEDWCQGPGNILYVHADGNIAPCCGFANENPSLFIGKITDSFEQIIQNARQNKMIKLCFEEGLSHYRRHGLKKILKEKKQKLPGRTSDICSFCDYVCKI